MEFDNLGSLAYYDTTMFALVSDIHSNLEALTAVLADAEQRGVSKFYCLGDVIGYGPDPCACLDLIMGRTSECILGNHDCAVLYEPTRFNQGAEQAAYWTRAQLEAEPDPALQARRWEFLSTRPVSKRLDGSAIGSREILLAHGSPRRPINEYLFPDDIYTAPAKLTSSMARVEHICFVGHTHVPGVFTEKGVFLNPADMNQIYEFTDDKAIINVGSVGQPRDRDPRAGYVIVSKQQVQFIRVPYDAEATKQKVLLADGLNDFLGERLIDGR
jgi:predicted phosphodiesterase